MARLIRQVVENYSVSSVIDAEQSIWPRLGDAVDALIWWLARNAEDGELIDDVNWLYMQQGDKHAKVPALVVVYTFNSWQVTLKHILVAVP